MNVFQQQACVQVCTGEVEDSRGLDRVRPKQLQAWQGSYILPSCLFNQLNFFY